MSVLEPMSDFFTARVDGYDEHMLANVEGCKEGYVKMAERIPSSTNTLLDLGCGTGLELDEIFKRYPKIAVTGVDLTESMLDKLAEKHFDKNIELICGDYFKIDFGVKAFDCTVSFQTMHHFSSKSKLELYKKIHSCLKDGGIYIECDYMVISQEEEDYFFNENMRLRKEQGICEDEFYHFDTPFTVDNQIKLLLDAGFESVNQIFRQGNTTMLVAEK